VSVALADAQGGGCRLQARSGPIRRLYHVLTGNTPAGPLADPRLEAVRSFVCETRRYRRPARQHVPALLAHGFNSAQVDALALLVA
jgi:hypothetical protein